MKFNSIETSSKGLLLEVELGSVCNYRCSYCLPRLHEGDVWIDYDKLIEFIHKINPYHVILVGGEPTLYPMIDQLLYELKNKIVNITSNGSRPLSWWKSYFKYFDILTLSHHIEYTNLKSFINKLKFLTDHKVVTVNVSMVLDRFDECLEVGKELAKIKNIYISLKALTDNETGYMYKYSNDQLEIMSDLIRSKVSTISSDHNIYFYGKREDGKLKQLRAQTIKSEKVNMYRGWKCWKGIQLIKLAGDGNIYKATCDIGRGVVAGNIYNDEFTLPTEPEVCQKDYCNCLTDLKAVKKERI